MPENRFKDIPVYDEEKIIQIQSAFRRHYAQTIYKLRLERIREKNNLVLLKKYSATKNGDTSTFMISYDKIAMKMIINAKEIKLASEIPTESSPEKTDPLKVTKERDQHRLRKLQSGEFRHEVRRKSIPVGEIDRYEFSKNNANYEAPSRRSTTIILPPATPKFNPDKFTHPESLSLKKERIRELKPIEISDPNDEPAQKDSINGKPDLQLGRDDTLDPIVQAEISFLPIGRTPTSRKETNLSFGNNAVRQTPGSGRSRITVWLATNDLIVANQTDTAPEQPLELVNLNETLLEPAESRSKSRKSTKLNLRDLMAASRTPRSRGAGHKDTVILPEIIKSPTEQNSPQKFGPFERSCSTIKKTTLHQPAVNPLKANLRRLADLITPHV